MHMFYGAKCNCDQLIVTHEKYGVQFWTILAPTMELKIKFSLLPYCCSINILFNYPWKNIPLSKAFPDTIESLNSHYLFTAIHYRQVKRSCDWQTTYFFSSSWTYVCFLIISVSKSLTLRVVSTLSKWRIATSAFCCESQNVRHKNYIDAKLKKSTVPCKLILITPWSLSPLGTPSLKTSSHQSLLPQPNTNNLSTSPFLSLSANTKSLMSLLHFHIMIAVFISSITDRNWTLDKCLTSVNLMSCSYFCSFSSISCSNFLRCLW